MQDWRLVTYKEVQSFAPEWLDRPGPEPKDIRARRCIGNLSKEIPAAVRERLVTEDAIVYRTYYWCNENCLDRDPKPRNRATVKQLDEMADAFIQLETTDDMEVIYNHIAKGFDFMDSDPEKSDDELDGHETKEGKKRRKGEDGESGSDGEDKKRGRFRMTKANRLCEVDLIVSSHELNTSMS
jgi:hypothetical protein